MSEGFVHEPVLLEEVAELLKGCTRVLDGTVGGGGHAARLAAQGAAIMGFDRDPRAIEAARARLGTVARVAQGDFAEAARDSAVTAFHPDGILLDLGVSSPQLDDPARGFSFRRGTALDMRMTPGGGASAADWLNGAEEPELAAAFRDGADERRARALAREIARRRTTRPFADSDDLVGAIRAVLGQRSGPDDFARLFQAVRIAVNGELERLREALPALLEVAAPGAVLAVISYHSGEDREVKVAMREWARACVCPPRQPVCTCRGRPLGTVLTKRPIRPAEGETARNPRARSARLRAFRKAVAPVSGRDQAGGGTRAGAGSSERREDRSENESTSVRRGATAAARPRPPQAGAA
jgi:16S rRNA (cytosine1402-N4)-methyltransferase